MENNTQIDALYSEMLKAADSVAQDGITEKSIEQLKSIENGVNQLTLGENVSESSFVTTSYPEDGPVITLEIPQRDTDEPVCINEEKQMVEYDPSTGTQKVLNNSSDLASRIASRHLDNLQNLNASEISSEIISEVFSSGELTKGEETDEATKLSAMIARRMCGDKFDAYEEAPEGFKKQVDSIYMELIASGKVTKPGMLTKKNIAKMMLDDMVNDFKKSTSTQLDIDTILSGFDDEVKKMQDEMSSELGNMMMGFDDERKAEIDAAIKRCTEDGKMDAVENLQKIRNNLDRAYDLTEFIEFCKTCKIKNGEVKEPKRVFDYFNNKYTNHKMVINDIRSCPDILKNHLTEYNETQSLILCMAFCKFCLFMHPDNIEEHTFMYYFIRNIIAIDRLNPRGNVYVTLDERSKTFYDGFMKNLRSAMQNLLERNPNFK